jgi:hypothetical protein
MRREDLDVYQCVTIRTAHHFYVSICNLRLNLLFNDLLSVNVIDLTLARQLLVCFVFQVGLETELHRNGQAQTLLDGFCRHQARINPGSDLTDSSHWDHAILLTGYIANWGVFCQIYAQFQI